MRARRANVTWRFPNDSEPSIHNVHHASERAVSTNAVPLPALPLTAAIPASSRALPKSFAYNRTPVLLPSCSAPLARMRRG